MNPIRQDEINNKAWAACDTFRGAIDSTLYKDYVLVMLFLKYLSDLWQEKREAYERQYKGDQVRVQRALSRERFAVPDGCDFQSLYSQREASNLGEVMNIALAKLEDANKKKLEGVFANVDFNSESLGETKDRNRRLHQLLEVFSDSALDLRPARLGGEDIIGNTYEFLIERFAGDAGKKGGEFYTPRAVARLMARLLSPKPGSTICDPTCGSGSLLIRIAEEVAHNAGNDQEARDFSLFGQESNFGTWALCRMNMFLHGLDGARIERGDTLNSPKLLEDDKLMRFDIVVANPPFSLDKWGAENAPNDRFRRFWRGTPPKSKGDYAFISHMVEVMKPGVGRMAVVAPHGVIFRGGSEGTIRQKLVEENLLKAVIGLPANLFFGTGIPAVILVLDHAKTTTDVLFIDASREFVPGRNQNSLGAEHIDKIVETFSTFENIDKYAYRATVEELRGNDYNLNIPRYVDTFEQEEEVDIVAVQQEINGLERELSALREEMNGYLRKLGYVPDAE